MEGEYLVFLIPSNYKDVFENSVILRTVSFSFQKRDTLLSIGHLFQNTIEHMVAQGEQCIFLLE